MLISKKKERRREEKERGTERRKVKQNVTRARIGTFLSSHHCAYADIMLSLSIFRCPINFSWKAESRNEN